MIVARLSGGLGNQMFQYAAARRLAYLNDDRLKLDTRWFAGGKAGDTSRPYHLSSFAITADMAQAEESARLQGIDIRRWPRVAKRLLTALGYRPPGSYVREKDFRFDPAILHLTGDVYLDGCWQSERYFQGAEEIIRREFTLKTPLSGRAADLLDQISGADAISVHFRRGDYVTLAAAASYHGTVSMDYYRQAIDLMCRKLQNPVLFAFSDDPAWVRANLTATVPVVYVEEGGPQGVVEDMMLMSACKHHIIANSSFSWWGAWLGANPEKTVIAPKQWFQGADCDTRDLLPEGWMQL